MKTCHIFAGGIIADLNYIKINKNDMIICADSGYKYVQQLKLIPDIIVGDFDSYNGNLPEKIKVIRSVPEKDDTDTLLAVKIAIENEVNSIKLYGALGGRIDHTFANVQTLKYAYEHNCKMIIEDYDNIIMYQSCETKEYLQRKDWYFSVFSFSEYIYIHELSGVKYPLTDTIVTNGFPIGVSNEIISDKAVLDIKSGDAIVVYSKK